jgi:hypothetical protein
MFAVRKCAVALYVDRATRQWIIRDPEGNFWMMPSVQDAWEIRRPFEPTEDADLEPVPGHYKHQFDLPF